PVTHELPHHQAGVGALDSRDGEDTTGDAVEIVSVLGDHVDHQVHRSGNTANLQHFGNFSECSGNLVEPVLGHLGGDERGERIPQRSRRNAALERIEDALLHAGEPGLGRVAGDADAVSKGESGRAGVLSQLQQDLGIDRVDWTIMGHCAHLSAVSVGSDCADCSTGWPAIEHQSSKLLHWEQPARLNEDGEMSESVTAPATTDVLRAIEDRVLWLSSAI